MGKSKKTILLVEDETIVAAEEALVLEEAGYAVINARSGGEAVSIARGGGKIDLVLMDIDLGKGMDGTEAASAILAVRDVPVVFLSSHTEPEIVEKTERITSYGYVVKNSGNHVLFASLKMAFRLHEAHVRLKEKEDALTRSLDKIEQKAKEIHASEERHRRLYLNAPLGYQSLDADGNIIEVNPAWLDTLGYTRDEVIGRWFGDFIAPSQVAAFRERFPRFKQAGEISGAEFKMIRKNGDSIIVSFNGKIGYDEDGGFKATHCIFSNITEQKSIQEALRKSEDELRTIMKYLPDIVARFDRELRYLYVSPAITAVSGRSPEYFIGKTSREAGIPGEQVSQWEEALRQVWNTGGNLLFEYSFPSQDGVRYFESHLAPEFSPDGEVLSVFSINRDITGSKRAKEEARFSQGLAQAAVDATRDWIYVIDRDFRVVLSNRSANQSGNSLDENSNAVGRKAVDAFPFLTPENLDGYRGMFEDGNEITSEQTCSTANGEIFFEVTHTPIVIDGRVEYLMSRMRDITEKRRAREELALSRENYRTLIEEINDVIYTTDEKGVITLITPMIFDITGYRPEEMTGRPFSDFIHPDDLKRIVGMFQKLSSGHVESSEYRIITKAGDMRWIRTSSRPVITDGVFRGLRGVLTDVTDRKKAEIALLKSDAGLLRAQRIGRLGNWEWNILEQKLSWSDEIYHIFGVDRGFTPDYDSILDLVHPDDREANNMKVRELIDSGEKADFEFRILSPDGGIRYIQQTAEAARNNAGEVETIFGVMQDITERKLNEDKITRAVEERKAAYHELQHRMKNSLAIIKGLVGMEKRKTPDPSFKNILQNLIDRIGAMARLYEKLNPADGARPLPLGPYLSDLCGSLSASYTLDRDRINITVNTVDILIDVRTAVSIGLIVNELVTNAIKHSFPDGRTGTIAVGLKKSAGGAVLSVRDDGIGAPEGFESTVSMGVTIVKMLARQIDGSIEWKIGNGTEAVLKFPLPAEH